MCTQLTDDLAQCCAVLSLPGWTTATPSSMVHRLQLSTYCSECKTTYPESSDPYSCFISSSVVIQCPIADCPKNSNRVRLAGLFGCGFAHLELITIQHQILLYCNDTSTLQTQTVLTISAVASFDFMALYKCYYS